MQATNRERPPHREGKAGDHDRGVEGSAAAGPRVENPEPRWPALVAAGALGALYGALSPAVAVGPRWLLPSVIAVLLVPTVVAHRTGRHSLNQILGYVINALITLAVIGSLSLLIAALPQKLESPSGLLFSAASLWASNVLVFALWYWRLDGGGPRAREVRGCHVEGALLFPQMQMEESERARIGQANWTPGFVDYLFVAYGVSAAFSPTDTPVLSRWAKVLTMIQGLISLTTVAVLLSRAVGVL